MIGNIDLNRAMTGINDFNVQRYNEEAKPMVDQTNIEQQVQQNVAASINNVHRGDATENHQKKFDAKEKGSNEYSGDGGKKRKNTGATADGKVVPKGYVPMDFKI